MYLQHWVSVFRFSCMFARNVYAYVLVLHSKSWTWLIDVFYNARRYARMHLAYMSIYFIYERF